MTTCYLSPAPSKKIAFKLPVLRSGNSGSTVRVLQQLLNFKGFSLIVDGEFDSQTQEAVKQFQRMNHLPDDGIVDAKTWHHISVGLLPLDY